MMSKLRVGLIGFGTMGKHHARVLNSLQSVVLVGIFDPVESENVYSHNTPVYRKLEDLMDQQIDYAVVAAPTKFHFQIAMQLADAKICALIEKPISYDRTSAELIVNKFADIGLIGAVGHIERFNPAVIEAKKRIQDLGPIFQIATRRQGPFPGRISDVGVTIDLATHDIDLARWITGQEYVDISARISCRSGRESEDMMIASARLSEGTIANHVVNWLSPKKERLITLIGGNGSFEIDTLNADLTYFANGIARNSWDELARFRGVTEGDVVRFSFAKKEPLVMEHENFVNAMLGLESSIVTLEEGLKAVEVSEAILTSAARGSVVFL